MSDEQSNHAQFNIREEVQRYLDRGYHLIPLRPGEKIPAIRDWTDPNVIRDIDPDEWWGNRSNHNVGMPMGAVNGGLVALDVDTKNGTPGLASLEELRKTTGESLSTWTNGTPNEGIHLIFRPPACLPWNKIPSVNRFSNYAGIEVKSDGTQIVVPPSTTPNGNYIVEELFGEPAEMPFALLLEIMEAVEARTGGPVFREDILPGCRNDTLFREASRMRSMGASEKAIYAYLQQRNADLSEPIEDDTEIRQIAQSAARYSPEVTEVPDPLRYSDMGNAAAFVGMWIDIARYCVPRHCWFVWNGMRWREDDEERVVKLARIVLLDIYDKAWRASLDEKEKKKRAAWAINSGNRTRVSAMLELAHSDMSVRVEALDADGWLLNVANGVIDLRNIESGLHPHGEMKDKMITMQAPVNYDPTAECPT